MVATEAWVNPIDVLENVGEPGGREFIRSKPPAEVGEDSGDRRKRDADQCEPCQRTGRAKMLPRDFCWGSRDGGHFQIKSNRTVEGIGYQ
jgi:hypothetical protein